MNNEMKWTNMMWCCLALLITGITPLNVWANDYNKLIEQTQDISQPGEDVYILHYDWMNFPDKANDGALLCLSKDDPSNGACSTSMHWNTYYNPAKLIRLMFTDLKTGKTTTLALRGYRESYCRYQRYALDSGGGCVSMGRFYLWIPASERRKLTVGQWTARLLMRLDGVDSYWSKDHLIVSDPYPVGSLVSDITLNVTDHFAENAAIYFPQFGTATPRVDLNLHRINATQISGRANLDMCLYDGGVKAKALQIKVEGSNKSGPGFQVIKNDLSDTLDYDVSMNYGGRSIPVTRGVVFSLDNVDKAATRPVVLPGQRQAVRCVPAPLTLTTQPFNIRDKSSGEYQGSLTVTMLMGTQAP